MAGSNKISKDTPSGDHDQIRKLLDGYPDAALMARSDASVVATNDKGVGLKTLLEHGEAEAIPQMIEKAAAEQTVVVGPILFKGVRGEVLIEVSVTP